MADARDNEFKPLILSARFPIIAALDFLKGQGHKPRFKFDDAGRALPAAGPDMEASDETGL